MIKFLNVTDHLKFRLTTRYLFNRLQFFSTELDNTSSTSQLNRTQTLSSIQRSPSVQKKQSRLRHKAGLSAFEQLALNRPTNVLPSELTQVGPSGLFRTRTQLERAQMNHKERSIALDLLEDLGIPIEEIQLASSSESIHQHPPSPIHDLLQRPEFKSNILQKSSSSSSHTLLRRPPNQLSPEEIRLEDIVKELTDSQIRKMDSFETDFQLLEWVDKMVFSHSRRSSSKNSDIQTNSPSQALDDDQTTNKATRLGQVFEKQNQDQQFNLDLEDELDYVQDPDKMLNQPLCFTPLFSPILLHLLKLTCQKLKNPYLALYLFNWTRSHPDPIVKYFGLTRETYFENMQIKWNFFKDFKGIKEDLIEMKTMGLELDERFKNLIQSITRVVWEDELNTEKNPCNTRAINLPNVTQAERYHVSQIESVLHEFIESQNLAFASKLRALPVETS